MDHNAVQRDAEATTAVRGLIAIDCTSLSSLETCSSGFAANNNELSFRAEVGSLASEIAPPETWLLSFESELYSLALEKAALRAAGVLNTSPSRNEGGDHPPGRQTYGSSSEPGNSGGLDIS